VRSGLAIAARNPLLWVAAGVAIGSALAGLLVARRSEREAEGPVAIAPLGRATSPEPEHTAKARAPSVG
jgi:hypothetical protein